MSNQAETPWWFILVVGDRFSCGLTHYFRLIRHEEMEIEKGSQSRNEQKEHGNSKFAKLKVAFNPAGLVVAKLDCNVDHTWPI